MSIYLICVISVQVTHFFISTCVILSFMLSMLRGPHFRIGVYSIYSSMFTPFYISLAFKTSVTDSPYIPVFISHTCSCYWCLLFAINMSVASTPARSWVFLDWCTNCKTSFAWQFGDVATTILGPNIEM